MANIREISGRIRSIQDTMKITNAMYMISSTKMRKAKKEQEGNLPYFAELKAMARQIVDAVPDLENPFLDLRSMKKGKDRVRAIIVIAGDKGLAGAYNHNVLKLAEELMQEELSYKLYVVGEVGRQYFAGKKVEMAGQFQYTAQNPSLHRARVIAERLIEEFLKGEIDEAMLVYTGMKNNITSEATFLQILPLVRDTVVKEPAGSENSSEEKSEKSQSDSGELQFVPSAQVVLENIVPDLLVGGVYSALVESYCSEQNDRMMAMDAANKNASAMIHDLAIQYNRERQALITQEITEVIAGAKAQKKKKAQKQLQMETQKES